MEEPLSLVEQSCVTNDSLGDAIPTADQQENYLVTFGQVTAAAYRIRSSLIDTPCSRSRMSEQLDMHVWLKKDFMQYTGSFKERGVRYALFMLDEQTKRRGVALASAGSYAYAFAYHGNQLNVPIYLFMPTFTPLMNIQSCDQYGAHVFVKGDSMPETTCLAREYCALNNIRFINTRCDRLIATGNATIGLDVIKQIPQVDAVIIPVCDGTLVAGTALAIKTYNSQIQVIACRHTSQTAKNEESSSSRVSQTADSEIKTSEGEYALHLVDKVVTTSEEENATAIISLIEMEKCMVEEEAACSFAALLSGRLPELRGKNVVVLLTGGNTDTTKIERIIERGLVAVGRLHHFSLVISDKPGGLRELCNIIADLGICIKDIFHERRFVEDIGTVQVRCVVEAHNSCHAEELIAQLRKRYGQVHSGIDPTTYGVDLRQLYDFS